MLSPVRWALAAALVLAPTAARAQDLEPRSGTGGIITGSILLGAGAVNLITAPACLLDDYVDLVGEQGSQVCLGTSLVLGGGLAVVGGAVLAGGLHRKREHKEWRERTVSLAVAPTLTPKGGGLALVGRF
jgi:hypothetical protein